RSQRRERRLDDLRFRLDGAGESSGDHDNAWIRSKSGSGKLMRCSSTGFFSRYRQGGDMAPHPLSDDVLDQLFRKARTHNAWLDRPVGDDLLRQLYDLMKWGPTSANLSPARILFLRTRKAKERLRPALQPAN